MKLKLDENIGGRGLRLLRLAGHDVVTVREQNLCSAPDRELIAICRKEQRCIVTLDLEGCELPEVKIPHQSREHMRAFKIVVVVRPIEVVGRSRYAAPHQAHKRGTLS